jgi:REP element-mobilizing transposase RayT
LADVLNEVHLHLVWAVWDRRPLLTDEVRALVYQSILATAATCRCDVKAIGGIEDHVHVAVQFATTIAVADLVKQMKGSSSHLANEVIPSLNGTFKWQGSYGVFPVERASLALIIRYVERQEEHHRGMTTDLYLEQVFRSAPVSPA